MRRLSASTVPVSQQPRLTASLRRESWIDPGTRWDADGSRDNTWTRLDDFFTGTENWKWHSGGFERPVVDMCNARECSSCPLSLPVACPLAESG